MTADLHIHTAFSCDSDADMEQYILRAIDKKMHMICFTDHVDLNPYDYGYLYYNGEEYYLPDIPTYKQHPDYTSFAKNCISLILSDPLINSEADPNGIHVIVRCSSVERDDGSHDSCSAFLKVSEETALSLIEQINALKEAKSNPQVQYQY